MAKCTLNHENEKNHGCMFYKNHCNKVQERIWTKKQEEIKTNILSIGALNIPFWEIKDKELS